MSGDLTDANFDAAAHDPHQPGNGVTDFAANLADGWNDQGPTAGA